MFIFRNVYCFQINDLKSLPNSDKRKHELHSFNTSQLRSINSSFSTFRVKIVSDAHYICGSGMKEEELTARQKEKKAVYLQIITGIIEIHSNVYGKVPLTGGGTVRYVSL